MSFLETSANGSSRDIQIGVIEADFVKKHRANRLPALAASAEPDLALCTALPTFAAPVWLCYHESRKDDPLLRTVAGFLGDWIGERGGRGDPARNA